MSTFMGPNGRIYKKKRRQWIPLSMIAACCLAAVAALALR